MKLTMDLTKVQCSLEKANQAGRQNKEFGKRVDSERHKYNEKGQANTQKEKTILIQRGWS